MSLNWIDVSSLPFDTLHLLERFQIELMMRDPQPSLGLALRANPTVARYLKQRAPSAGAALDALVAQAADELLDAGSVRKAEIAVMDGMQDWLVYALDPSIYDGQPFLTYDSGELTGLVNFAGKFVIDVGSGTGRLAWVAAQCGAATVYAVEPVAALRDYLWQKAERDGLANLYVVDGLITRLPFPSGTADVVMGGHVYGDDPQEELAELERITRVGGMVILCPGNNDEDNAIHAYLAENGYRWSVFEEPGDGRKRKYWKQV